MAIMASKKLGPVAEKAVSGFLAGQRSQPVLDLLVEHNMAVKEGRFSMPGLPRDERLAMWERFFEIGSRSAELPAWASKPGLEETNGTMCPTMGEADRSSLPRSGRPELRQAVDVLRSSVRTGTPSREDKLRMAETAFGSGPFAVGMQHGGPER